MIQINDLTKVYESKTKVEVKALNKISLNLPDKGFVFILGKSGSGKSTLLNVLGGLDSYNSGDIIFDGISYNNLSKNDIDKVRNTLIGFVFQSYNILPDLTVGANILLADELQGRKADLEKLNNVLDLLDLKSLALRKPSELSGGQLQRVAIARTLMKDCRLLLADEPTGALDSKTGKRIFDVLKETSKERLVLCVSHNEDLAREYADRIITISDGEIIKDEEILSSSILNYSDDIKINKNGIEINKSTNISLKDLKEIVKEIENFKEEKKENKEKLVYGKNSKPELIASSLSYKNSLHLALSSLKVKPLRFAIAVLLSFISFALFGLSIVMADYDASIAIEKSIPGVVDYVSVKKSNQSVLGESIINRLTAIDEEDITKLSNKLNVNFKGVYRDNLELNFSNSIYDITKVERNYYTDTLTGLMNLTLDDVQTLGYNLYGTLPTEKGEIAITKYVYDHFACGGLKDYKNNTYILSSDVTIEKVIGSSIRIDEKDYVITGIVDTLLDLDRYGYLINGEGEAESYSYSEFRTIRLNSYLDIGFISSIELQDLVNEKNPDEPLITRYGSLTGSYNYTLDGKSNSSEISFSSIRNDTLDLALYGVRDINDETIIINWYDYYSYLNTIGVLENISYSYGEYTNLKQLFNSLSKEEFKDIALLFINDLTSQYNNIELSMSFFTTYINQIASTGLNSLKINGVYFTETSFTGAVSPYLYNIVMDRLGGIYDFAIGAMPSNASDIKKVVNITSGSDKVVYEVTNQITETVSSLSHFINTLANVFKYVGIGFAIFALLMLYNFLSTSIYYKHKDIGILRALGARKQNVFMIFFNESIILALINAFLASICLIIGAIIINQNVKQTYNVLINVLNINLLHILMIFLLSIVSSFISSFLPIKKITNAMPLEILKD